MSESAHEVRVQFSHLAVLGLSQPFFAGGSLACHEFVGLWTIGDGLRHGLKIKFWVTVHTLKVTEN